MTRTIFFLSIIIAGGCTTKRLPPLPPERDPTAESAPVAPWRAPPDVLNAELSEGAPAGSGHEHMHHAEPSATPPGKPDEPDPHAGHDAGGSP